MVQVRAGEVAGGRVQHAFGFYHGGARGVQDEQRVLAVDDLGAAFGWVRGARGFVQCRCHGRAVSVGLGLFAEARENHDFF